MRELILFRTHVFDDATKRFYEYLKATSNRDIVIVAEESRGPLDVGHGRAKISLTRDHVATMGLRPHENFGWLCGDYFLYLGVEAFANYDKYWLIEYDVRLGYHHSADFFDFFGNTDADMMAFQVRKSESAWSWHTPMMYFNSEVHACNFSLISIKRDAALATLEMRREMSKSYQDVVPSGIARNWPNDESFLATSVVSAGFKLAGFNALGREFSTDTSFKEGVPLSDSRLTQQPKDGLVYHPVHAKQTFKRKVDGWIKHFENLEISKDSARNIFNDQLFEDMKAECGAESALELEEKITNWKANPTPKVEQNPSPAQPKPTTSKARKLKENMKIGLLWESKDCGIYSNASFESLYRKVGHNNGNLAFVHAVKTQIDAEILYFPWHTNPETFNEQVDAVVIPCANQLGKHTDLGGLAKNLSRVTKPIIAIGLGAQASGFESDIELTEGTRAWLDVLIANGQKHGIQNICTRGPYTSEQIKKLTGFDTLANGCPSHFINPRPDLGAAIEKNWNSQPLPQRIAVAGGHESWKNTREIEQQLISMMMDPLSSGVYIVQSMGNMIKISRGLFDDIEPDALHRIHQHTVPHYTLEQFKQWALNYSRSYYDVATWMDELRRHDLLIGPRFHGAQLAIQAERMACTITIDTRTEEMCRETGIPFLRARDLKEPLTRAKLKSLIKFDGQAYDAFRATKCARYVQFLQNAGLKPADYLLKIAASAPTSEPSTSHAAG